LVLLVIIIQLTVGLLVGWLAGKIMNVDFGLVMRFILGICGSVIGGWIAALLGSSGSFMYSVGGACLLIFAIDRMSRR